MTEWARTAQVKDDIRQVAARRFAEHGFSATGVREIAREAGVDPSVVIRHFGTKSGLFREVIHLPDSWQAALTGPLEELGPSVVRVVADQRGDELSAYAVLMQASDRKEIGDLLSNSMHTLFVVPLIERLQHGDHAELRARLFVAQLQGLMDAIRIRRDPYLLAMPTDDLVTAYGGLLQRTLTGPDILDTEQVS